MLDDMKDLSSYSIRPFLSDFDQHDVLAQINESLKELVRIAKDGHYREMMKEIETWTKK